VANDITFKIGADARALNTVIERSFKKQMDQAAKLEKQRQQFLDRAAREKAKIARVADLAAKKELAHIEKARKAEIKAIKDVESQRKKSSLGRGLSRGAGIAAGGTGAAVMGLGAIGGGALAIGAMTVGLSQAVSLAANLEYEMQRVKIVSNATDAEFAQMMDTVRDLGSRTIFTAQEAAEGMRFLAMAGMSATDSIQALPAVLGIAEVGMMDLGSAADITTNIMAGFGFKASDLKGVGDELVATFTNSNTTLTELGEAFKNAGPVAKTAGVEFEDTAAALGMLANAGFKGERAGVGIRNIIANLVKPSKDAKKSFQVLNVSAKDLAEGGLMNVIMHLRSTTQGMTDVEKTSHLMTAFGRRAGPQVAALLNQSQEAFEDLRTKIDDSKGSMDKFQALMRNTVTGRAKQLTSAVHGLAESLGDALAPATKNVLESMRFWVDHIQDLVSWYRSLIEVTVEAGSASEVESLKGERGLARMLATTAKYDRRQIRDRILAGEDTPELNAEYIALSDEVKLQEGLAKRANDAIANSFKRLEKVQKDAARSRRKAGVATDDRSGGSGLDGPEAYARWQEKMAKIQEEQYLKKEEQNAMEVQMDLREEKRIRDLFDARIAANQARIEDERRTTEIIEQIQREETQMRINEAMTWYNGINSVALQPLIGATQGMFDDMITGQDKWAEAAAANFLSASGTAVVGMGMEAIARGVVQNATLPGSGVPAMAAGAGLVVAGIGMGAGATALNHLAAGGTIGQALPDSGVGDGGIRQATREDPVSKPTTINIQLGVVGHPEDIADTVVSALALAERRGR
jgi:TP901 family phage tail tape measure protein